MRGNIIRAVCTSVLLLLAVVSQAKASIMISEIFADPATDLTGDANRDGVRSATADEFIELLNYSDNETDISGWSLHDAVASRHVFPANTIISPYSYLVVFGGGSPQLPDVFWQTASSGSLSLNNTNETVSLYDPQGQLIDSVVYGSIGNNDQSIVLFPEGTGTEFVLHSELNEAQGALFSPGTSVDGRAALVMPEDELLPDNAVVPELSTLIYLGAGLGSLLLKRRPRSDAKVSKNLSGFTSNDVRRRLCRADQVRV